MARALTIPLFQDDTAEENRRILSEDQIARKRAMAEALRQQAANAGTIESPWEGMAQLSNAAFGALTERKAEREADRRQAALAAALGGIYGGGGAVDPAKLQMLTELDPQLGFQIQQQAAAQQQAQAQQQAAWDRDDRIRAEGYAREDANRPSYTTLTDDEERAMGLPTAGVYQRDSAGRVVEAYGAPARQGASPSDVSSVRKEFENQPGVSRLRVAGPILNSMAASIDTPNSMADLDFIYGMAKIFDPESVVRESEMGLVLQGQNLPDQVVGWFDKIANGGAALQPQIRRQLVEASITRVDQYRQQAEQEAQFFTSYAQRNNINPADIVRPLESLPTMPQQQPPAPSGQQGGGQQQALPPPVPGEQRDGYRFLGGDPANPTSWERIGNAGGGR